VGAFAGNLLAGSESDRSWAEGTPKRAEGGALSNFDSIKLLAETECAGRLQSRALGVSLSKLATSASAGVALGRRRRSGRSARSGAPAGARNARDRCAIAVVLGKPYAMGSLPKAETARGFGEQSE
jgi:hypothetical protein